MSKFEIISGVEGKCLCIDETRVAGPKPWGGGTIVDSFTTDERYVPERTCSIPLMDDEEEIARRKSQAKPGTFVTQDIPMCRKCTSCGGKFRPWSDLPKWLLYCPLCGAKVVE